MNEAKILFDELFVTVSEKMQPYIFIGIIAFFVGIILFILQGIALFQMSGRLKLKNSWISFIPLIWIFSFGRVAQNYVRADGKKSAKLGIILIIFQIIQIVLAIAVVVATFFATAAVIDNANLAIENDVSMTLDMFSQFIFVIVLALALFAVAVTYKIIYFVSLWRIFSVFDNGNATLYTTISFFFDFMSPIFLFFIRKKEPLLTFEQRNGLDKIYENV